MFKARRTISIQQNLKGCTKNLSLHNPTALHESINACIHVYTHIYTCIYIYIYTYICITYAHDPVYSPIISHAAVHPPASLTVARDHAPCSLCDDGSHVWVREPAQPGSLAYFPPSRRAQPPGHYIDIATERGYSYSIKNVNKATRINMMYACPMKDLHIV